MLMTVFLSLQVYSLGDLKCFLQLFIELPLDNILIDVEWVHVAAYYLSLYSGGNWYSVK